MLESNSKLYYSIKEVSEMTELKPYVLRYWESEFPSLKPSKNRSGNRTYKKHDIQVILDIKKLLYQKKFTIKGAVEELKNRSKEANAKVEELLWLRPRIEKIAIKDAKLRTFITEDSNRDDLVAHVYDVTYGVVKPSDNLVVIDDSIVRGTTLQKSILKMLDRLGPKKIVVVSSAPQIRYPDCYGIDMARLEEFIAFKAAIALHREQETYNDVINNIYQKCVASFDSQEETPPNHVKEIYAPFTDDVISKKIGQILKSEGIIAEVEVLFQKIEDLHKACPKNLGDWYFSGDYPTPGGHRVVNRAFMNFYEGKSVRAY